MNYYIPTYEECLEICDAHGDLIFYENKFVIDGFNISTFNYRLAQYNNFINPLVDKPKILAKELRGLTFIFNNDNTLFNKFILLDKFWNLNQTEETLLSNIKDKPFKFIYNKEDGSCVHFVQLPNGKVLAKTKASFDCTQALMAQNIYDNNPYISNIVNWSLSKGLCLIWELVSPLNQIVLDYSKTDLILLKARDNSTGEYIDLTDLDYPLNFITLPELEVHNNWDDLIVLAETLEDKEGWVIQLDDNQFIKLKTHWYFERHRLLTDDVKREDFIIEKILDETIDDILSQLTENDSEIREFIDLIAIKVNDFILKMVNEINDNVKIFENEFNSQVKPFVLASEKNMLFAYTMSVINGKKNPVDVVILDIKDKTYRLEEARYFLREGKLKGNK